MVDKEGPQENTKEVEIEIDDNRVEDNEVVEDTATYCPSWMFPARLGPVKVSSVVKLLVLIVMGIAIGAFFILSIMPNSPVTGWITDFLTWIDSIPVYFQIIAILIFYVVSAPFGTPITLINLACGFLFKFWLGSIVALAGSMMGSAGCFFWGKTLLYKWAHEQMDKRRTLRALGIAVQTKAVFIIALTHLSPILPATLLHYTYSAVGVSFVKFSIGTLLGILPFVLVYVYIGSISRNLTEALSGGDDGESSLLKELGWMALIVGASALILVVVTWIARRELKKALKELDDEELEEEEEHDEDIVNTDDVFLAKGADVEIEMEPIKKSDSVPKDISSEEYITQIPVENPSNINLEKPKLKDDIPITEIHVDLDLDEKSEEDIIQTNKIEQEEIEDNKESEIIIKEEEEEEKIEEEMESLEMPSNFEVSDVRAEIAEVDETIEDTTETDFTVEDTSQENDDGFEDVDL